MKAVGSSSGPKQAACRYQATDSCLGQVTGTEHASYRTHSPAGGPASHYREHPSWYAQQGCAVASPRKAEPARCGCHRRQAASAATATALHPAIADSAG